MDHYKVTGMSCAACSSRVEKAVSKLDGVNSCSVSLLTNSMIVEGTASKDEIITAVENVGYGAELNNKKSDYDSTDHMDEIEQTNISEDEEMLKDTETPKLKRRLLTSIGFLLVLMYFSMGHMMWDFPIPSFFQDNHIAMGLLQLLLTIIIMVINRKFFINGIKGVLHRAPNMDTLVALGSGASFIYSTYALFAMTGEFYFESAAMILTLITVGKMLEAKSKGRTTDALKGLLKLTPKLATIEVDGIEKQVSVADVRVNTIFVVKPGESIPCDGVIIEGESAVDESALTGESIPVDKAPGDEVSAATINQSGFIRCRATRVGEDTTLSQIIRMVSDASATKAPIAKVADKVSGVFVPVVIGIAIITFIIWMLVGQTFGFALARAISVLVISCPCALGLATPVAIMVGNGIGAKNGILFKTAASLEASGRVQIVALDKTGTITKGMPVVTDVIPLKIPEEELLRLAAMLEQKSEHPLARAVVAANDKFHSYREESFSKNISHNDLNVTEFIALPGKGLQGKVNNAIIVGGSYKYISSISNISLEISRRVDLLAEQGKTPLLFTRDGVLIGIIAVADVIKEDSTEAIYKLKQMGLKVVMLTGDNEKTAHAIGAQAGVDEVIAGVLPDGKEKVIRDLQSGNQKVAMVGDGINDAPALTRADTGIAIGAGTDIAIDAADIVLMKSNLSDVVTAIRLSKATLRNIHENLFWAFIYNIIGIPLAAGVWIHLTGWQLNPMFGAAAMSLSSFCVVMNALRLNMFRINDKKVSKDINNESSRCQRNDKERTIMKKTIKIEGMMCGHCEARVKKTLEALEQVSEAVVSHEAGTAIVTLTTDVENEVLKKAIEEQDYKVTDIQ